MTKLQLRLKYKRIRSGITPLKRKQAAISVASLFRKNFPGRAGIVMTYLPLKEELDSRPIIRQLHKKGIKVFVPCIRNGRIVPCQYARGSKLAAGKFGIQEPVPARKCGPGTAFSAVIAPGLAFDRKGTRLGFGGGYFDRFLSALKRKPVKIGVCFHAQLSPSLPRKKHDVAMDYILTEKGLITCGKKD